MVGYLDGRHGSKKHLTALCYIPLGHVLFVKVLFTGFSRESKIDEGARLGMEWMLVGDSHIVVSMSKTLFPLL